MERVFQIFDKDESGSISFQEFLDAMHQFAGQTPDDKIKFLFKVYDIDGEIFHLRYIPKPIYLNLKINKMKNWLLKKSKQGQKM